MDNEGDIPFVAHSKDDNAGQCSWCQAMHGKIIYTYNKGTFFIKCIFPCCRE